MIPSDRVGDRPGPGVGNRFGERRWTGAPEASSRVRVGRGESCSTGAVFDGTGSNDAACCRAGTGGSGDVVGALRFGVSEGARPVRSVTTGRYGRFIGVGAVVATTSKAGTPPMGSVSRQDSFCTGDCPGGPEVAVTTVFASVAVSRCCTIGSGVTISPGRATPVADGASAASGVAGSSGEVGPGEAALSDSISRPT